MTVTPLVRKNLLFFVYLLFYFTHQILMHESQTDKTNPFFEWNLKETEMNIGNYKKICFQVFKSIDSTLL